MRLLHMFYVVCKPRNDVFFSLLLTLTGPNWWTILKKKLQLLKQNKKAGVIAYEKGYGTSQTNGI
jgi:hypothetical protein